MKDKKIEQIIQREQGRQNSHITLIASENFVSEDVLEATGSILTNKYAEGYPGKRYYGGTVHVDEIENLAIDRVRELFNVKYANVQAHSGSQANAAVYQALLEPGGKILGLSLDSGGHLTHGYPVNMSGKNYNAFNYSLNKETEQIDMNELEKQAMEIKPDIIIVGASSYPREFDFARFKEIGEKVGAYIIADISHIAGLIVTGYHPSPFDYGIDVVTSTTHKTLRGARGGVIMTNNEEIAQKVDKAIFPGTQGGPLVHSIAGKAVAFGEALQPEFKEYMGEVVKSAKKMSKRFEEKGYKITHGGTDTHMFLLNTKDSFGLKGNEAEELLGHAYIVVNKNMIPFDEERPIHTSGLRIGTPAMVTKGFKSEDFIKLADIIIEILESKSMDVAEQKIKEVKGILK